jgi:maltose/maltodextrin transport system substrate-binding protein
MMISGPWAWLNLMKSGIDFGVAPIPGVAGNPGRPFVGVSVAYLNRSSPNQDLAKEFLERYILTEEGLSAMDHGKPIGLPALISLQEKMVKDNALLQQLKVCVDYGEVMPNALRWAVSSAPWEQPCKSRQRVKLLLRQRCSKPRRTCDTSEQTRSDDRTK